MTRKKALPFLLLITCFAFVSLKGYTQTPVSFELIDYHVLDANHRIETFGGISSIENIGNKQQLLLIADHYRDGGSYLFSLNDAMGIEPDHQAPQLKDVESFRVNKDINITAYSFEGNHYTGLITITGNRTDTLLLQAIPAKNITGNRYTTYNRGIESVSFGKDTSLWMAFESGGDTGCDTTQLVFRMYRYNWVSKKYSLQDFTEYTYPFDRCNCSRDQLFDGRIGNGVSEILFLPGESGRLLVLERCFDGNTGHVMLWLATVHPETQTLTKEPVFDFNHTGSKEFAAFIPDNLEGMTWGTDKQGQPVLYIVSDDNYKRENSVKGKAQQTQLLKLRMKTGGK